MARAEADDCCAYVRNYYGVPARVGMRVRLQGGEEGVICKARSDLHYIHVRLDGQRHTGVYHPTDHVTYLTADGPVAFT